MNTNELNNLVTQLKISRDQIICEEAEMGILEELSKDKLGTKVLFYGGTALRLAYNSPRFSEDIDFLVIKPIKFSEFKKFIEKLLKTRLNWKLKDIKDKRNTIFALVTVYDEKLKHNFSVKIELHKPAKKVNLKRELILIKSPASQFEPLFLVPMLEELGKLKEQALAERKKARDIFDLWYIAKASRANFVLPEKLPAFSSRNFKNELQVFLPKKYYPVIDQLYDQINRKSKKDS